MTVGVSRDIQLLTGQGSEYLVDANNNVLLAFYNGTIVTGTVYMSNIEITLVSITVDIKKIA